MQVEEALHNGQLFSWREIETIPLDWLHEANLGTAWDVRGFPTAAVLTALGQLADRHAVLRTSFVLRDGGPRRCVHAAPTLPVEVLDRRVNGREDADRTTEELLRQPIPTTGGLCWRALLVTSGGAPVFLSVSFSHTVLDLWSTQLLGPEFHDLLAGTASPALAGDLAPRRRSESLQRYWSGILVDACASRLPVPPTGSSRPRIQATLHSPGLGVQVGRAADMLGVTPAGVLVALVTAVLGDRLDSSRVTIAVMASNRFTEARRSTVGTLNQLVPVAGDVDPDMLLSEHVRSWSWATTRAYRHADYDLDEVAGWAERSHGTLPAGESWFPRLFPAWFNYLPVDQVAPGAGAAALEWHPAPRSFGQPFDVRVTVRDGRTSLALRTDPEVFNRAAVTAALSSIAVGAALLASSTPVPTGHPERWSASPSRDLLPAALWRDR